MNVNLRITGELERFINRLVMKGLAANKTEAIRLAIVRYYEEQQRRGRTDDEQLNQSTIDAHWNNKPDEKSAEFYTRRYLREKA